jgi:hypothetical protein
MAQVLNKRDFYYGAFIFALLNKKIHPAAIVESDDEDCKICSMCTDQHDDFKLIMKYRVANDAKDKTDWGCSFMLGEDDKKELVSALEKKEKVKLALICVRENLNDSEIAIFSESEIKQLLSMHKDSFRIHFGDKAKKIDILLNRKTYFQIVRNWQIAFENSDAEICEKSSVPVTEEYNLMQKFQGMGHEPKKLKIDRDCYAVNSWKELFVQLCSWLVEYDTELFKSLANRDEFKGRTRKVIKMSENKMTDSRAVGAGIFIEVNYSADDILMYSRRMLSVYQEKYPLHDKVFVSLRK